MSYFHKSEHCISPAINPPADCRNQSLAGRAEPRENEAVVGHLVLLDGLKTLEQKSSTGSAMACSGWGEGSNGQPDFQKGIKEGEPSVGVVPSLIQESSAGRTRTVIIKAGALLPFLKWENQLL